VLSILFLEKLRVAFHRVQSLDLFCVFCMLIIIFLKSLVWLNLLSLFMIQVFLLSYWSQPPYFYCSPWACKSCCLTQSESALDLPLSIDHILLGRILSSSAAFIKDNKCGIHRLSFFSQINFTYIIVFKTKLKDYRTVTRFTTLYLTIQFIYIYICN